MSFASFYKTQEFYSWLSVANMSPSLYHQAEYKSMANATVAALDAISGHTWQKQFREERRADPAKGKALIFAALYATYHADYTDQEIVEYWDTMTVVAPITKGKCKSKQLSGQLTAPPTATATSTATTLETY